MTTTTPDTAPDILGTMPDREAAEALGLTVPEVYRMRQAAGIPSHRQAVREAAAPHLGKLPDAELADRIGVSVTSVAKWRKAAGIASTTRRRERRPYRDRLEDRHPGILALLGKVPDPEVATRYGITRQRVHMLRKRLGIDAARGR